MQHYLRHNHVYDANLPLMVASDILNKLIWLWIGIALLTFIILRFVSAPYGRHTRKGWGPQIANRIGWMIMELPGLIVMPTLFFWGSAEKTGMHFLLLGLYLLHYVNRAFIFPLRIRTKGKKMPIVIMGSAVFFNLVNTFFMGAWLGWYAEFSENPWIQIPFLIGILLFAFGMFINLQSDEILLNLRKPGETAYKIPNGGLFRLISCPNHFGEIIEWIGYALMAGNLAAVSFAIWSIANLVPRAIDHHKWYLDKFSDYPKKRKAIFPYIF